MSNGLPLGWEHGKDCVAFKHLQDFMYAEIRFEPESAPYSGNDYALYVVNRDGPRAEKREGAYSDLGKALKIGQSL